ncbi:DUF397 domain-containing protein [Actinophytocola sp.]|uniref:DUF397 domain-containing protein n=1 Tax=Actinophytocola sp. TaxID=1872138 RepID=UPI002EDB5749
MSTPRSGILTWRKSTFTDTHDCVELAWPDGEAAMRDSKNTEPTLVFDRARVAAFVVRVKSGAFQGPR